MEQFLRSCVDRYLEVAGDVKLNKVVTPELHEETKNHVSRKPAREGPSVVCNWCNNLVPTDGSATVPDQRGGTPELAMKEPVRGHLAPHAAKRTDEVAVRCADCSLRFVAASESPSTERA